MLKKTALSMRPQGAAKIELRLERRGRWRPIFTMMTVLIASASIWGLIGWAIGLVWR